MSYNTHLTEECPLTKEKNYKYKLCNYCGNGLQLIIACFVVLTIGITTMLVLQILYTEDIPQSRLHGIHGAVATDYSNCSQIGTKILRKLGNAVDAAVAATICMTVVAPHKTGLGGGGYMMIHKNHTHPIIIDFASNTTEGFFARAEIRLPALLRGLEFAQRSHGILPWRDIVEPSAKLAREGFVVSKDFADEVSKNTDYGTLYGPLNPGDTLQLQELANTLDIIAEHGAGALYNGTLSYKILRNDILSGNLLQQLASYGPTVVAAESSTLHHHVIYYPSHASSIRSVVEALEDLPIFAGNASTIESQALVAQTLTQLHLLFSQNTQHVKRETYTGVMAMDWQDAYVCVLSGLGSPLGLGNMTAAGFLLDKNVDDNTLLSTFVPVLFHHEKARCGLRGVFGSDDAFLNGQILYNLIVRSLSVSAAIEYPRYYYVSDGMVIENNQRHSMEAALRVRLQPLISSLPTDNNLLIKSVNAIIKRKDSLSSHSDSRGNGIASRF
ncbi:PREDICTED: gamma-glutamyltransferase 7-like [Dinoponera quadriceps]|uniref:Gamma-glutamyltransferase 7-like n=1 Tax=Dinoponera quadriceps TaxID=609295 RepID=A0A6P3XU27_DINQU|nr:PREDICTED: gamma-glutamyltransferase 7-like [Dinoponera quadriceps]